MNRALREATEAESRAWQQHRREGTDETYRKWTEAVRRRNGLRETGEADAVPSRTLLLLVGGLLALLVSAIVVASQS